MDDSNHINLNDIHSEINVLCHIFPSNFEPHLQRERVIDYDVIYPNHDKMTFKLSEQPWIDTFKDLEKKIKDLRNDEKKNVSINVWWQDKNWGFFKLVSDEGLALAVMTEESERAQIIKNQMLLDNNKNIDENQDLCITICITENDDDINSCSEYKSIPITTASKDFLLLELAQVIFSMMSTFYLSKSRPKFQENDENYRGSSSRLLV